MDFLSRHSLLKKKSIKSKAIPIMMLNSRDFRSKTICSRPSGFNFKPLMSLLKKDNNLDKYTHRSTDPSVSSFGIVLEEQELPEEFTPSSTSGESSPHISAVAKAPKSDSYITPSERRISTAKPIYLINDSFSSFSTAMSKIEFGYRTSDFSPLAFKTVFVQEHAAKELKFLELTKGLPGIVQLIDSFIDDDKNNVLVFPVLRQLTLSKLDLVDVGKYTHQLIMALSNIHQRGIVHLDVTPGNIMIDSDGDLVLIDFGLSSLLDDNSPCPSCGTPGYIAPEIFKRNCKLSTQADIYSAGIIFGCLLEPYLVGCDLQFLGGNMVRSTTTEAIISNLHSFLSRSPTGKVFLHPNNSFTSVGTVDCSEVPQVLYQAADMLASMLATDPTSRPSAQQLLEHPFMKSLDLSDSDSTPNPFTGTDLNSFEERRRVIEFRERQWHSMEESDDDYYYNTLSY